MQRNDGKLPLSRRDGQPPYLCAHVTGEPDRLVAAADAVAARAVPLPGDRVGRGVDRVMGKSKTVAQTASPPKAISPPSPGIPAAIRAVRLPVAASTRAIVPSPWLSTQIDPAPTVRNRGMGPTGVWPTTELVAGSTRTSVPQRWS